MPTLPEYDVIVWLQHTKFTEKLEQKILSIAEIEPYERVVYEGVLDIHWGFSDWNVALQFINKLEKYKENPNIFMIKASNYAMPDASLIIKDARPGKN